MARRRMFSLEMIQSDRFAEMPVEAQMLYIAISMHADDEGLLSSAKTLSILYGGAEYLQMLEEKDFIIRFDSGVVAVVDWYINNTIRKDRSAATIYQKERKCLAIVDGRYVKQEALDNQVTTTCQPNDNQLPTNCQPFANHLATQNRIEENRIEENRIEENRIDHNRTEYPGGENADTGADLDGEDDASGMEYEIPRCSDVQIFAEQEGLHDLDVTLFWAINTKNHWCDRDGRPIRDWRAYARAWSG